MLTREQNNPLPFQFKRSLAGISTEGVKYSGSKLKLLPYILLYYSNGGRADKEEIGEITNKHCEKIQLFSLDYKRHVMSGVRWTCDWTKAKEKKNAEFLK